MQYVVFFKIISLLLFGVATKAISLNEITSSDGASNDQFGYSVSISGTTAIVGAEAKSSGKGEAYIFSCSTPSNCTQASKLLASDGASQDSFGSSVSISGTIAIVGTPNKNSSQGAAYIFSCPTPSNCTQASKLVATDGASNDRFGYSVSISGTIAIVGAYYKTIGSNSYQGAAYIFSCPTPSNCTQASKLVATDGASGDYFGNSVSISGTTAIVGAPDKNGDHGAAYIFTCPTPSNCTQASKLLASNGASNDQFGYSVSISGTTAIVGADSKNIGSNSLQGAAYIFTCPTPSNCTQTSELLASDGASNDRFGFSVSISGTIAIVGAYYKTIGSNSEQGAVYIFNCTTPSKCTQASELVASDGAKNNQFGVSVSISGTTPIVGAKGNTINSHTVQGAAYVVDLSPSSPTPTATATATSTSTSTSSSTSTPTATATATSTATDKATLTSTSTSTPTSTSTSTSTSSPTSTATPTPTVYTGAALISDGVLNAISASSSKNCLYDVDGVLGTGFSVSVNVYSETSTVCCMKLGTLSNSYCTPTCSTSPTSDYIAISNSVCAASSLCIELGDYDAAAEAIPIYTGYILPGSSLYYFSDASSTKVLYALRSANSYSAAYNVISSPGSTSYACVFKGVFDGSNCQVVTQCKAFPAVTTPAFISSNNNDDDCYAYCYPQE